MEERRYDRAAEDLGNIVELGHVNVTIPEQRLATLYYVTGLGLTRDPIINVSTHNMWVNVGKSQFHLPTAAAEVQNERSVIGLVSQVGYQIPEVSSQVLRGTIGLVLPHRAQSIDRLERVRKPLEGTRFAFRETEDAVEVVCPWGNRFTCHFPDPKRFGNVQLGLAYIEWDTRPGTSEGIARFYREVIGAQAEAGTDARGRFARVTVGQQQNFIFRETDAPEAPFDGHHMQIYIHDFSGPYRRLVELGLITQESNQHQYRFIDITDLDTGKVLFTIDHEVRSMTHPYFGRWLVNRNPAQTVQHYRAGRDFLPWSTE